MWANASLIAASTSFGRSTRMPRIPMASATAREVRVVQDGAELREPDLLHLELDHAEPAVVEDDEPTGRSWRPR